MSKSKLIKFIFELPVFFILLLSLTTGCERELKSEETGSESDNEIFIRLSLADTDGRPLTTGKLRTGGPPPPDFNAQLADLMVSRVRIIAFDPASGTVRGNKLYITDAADLSLLYPLREATYNLVVICNEPHNDATRNALDAIATRTELNAFTFPAAAFNNTDPLPMTGTLDDVVIFKRPDDAPIPVNVLLVRIAARLDLTVRTTTVADPNFSIGKMTRLTLEGFPQTIPVMPETAYSRTGDGIQLELDNAEIDATFTDTAPDALPTPPGYGVATEQKNNRLIVPSWLFTPATNRDNAIRVAATFARGGEKKGVISYNDPAAPEGTTPAKHYAIRRNAIYRITLVGTATGATLETQISPWDEENTSDVVTPPQFELQVSADALPYYIGGGMRRLTVSTTHAGGWETEIPAYTADWLTLTPTTGATGIAGEISVAVTALPIPMTGRTGEFYIKAGSLKKRVRVTQTNEEEVSMEITPEALVFYRKAPQPKSVRVNIFPGVLPMVFTRIDGTQGGIINWRIFPADNTELSELAFQPAENTMGRTLNSIVNVYVTASDGTAVAKTIMIRQLATDLLFTAVPKSIYPATGGTETFSVTQAEAPWQIATVLPASGVVQLTHTEEHPQGTTGDYSFTLLPNPTWEKRKAHFAVTSSSTDFEPAQVSITQDSPVPLLTEPTPGTIDFAGMETPQTVTFETNCGWQQNNTDRWLKVTPPEGTWNNPSVMNPVTVALAPVPFAAADGNPLPGTPAAGVHRGNITLRTKDHGFLNYVQRTLTYTRTVPQYFSFVSSEPADGTKIGNVAQLLKVTAQTNNRWSLASSPGNSVQAPPAEYSTQELMVQIPENTTYDERPVAVEIRSGDQLVRTLRLTQTGRMPDPVQIPQFEIMEYDQQHKDKTYHDIIRFIGHPAGELKQPLQFEVISRGTTIGTFSIGGFPSVASGGPYQVKRGVGEVPRDMQDFYLKLSGLNNETVQIKVSDADGALTRTFNARVQIGRDDVGGDSHFYTVYIVNQEL